MEATISEINTAYKKGELTAERLVQLYLDRIEAYDKKGPEIRAMITVNPNALKEARALAACCIPSTRATVGEKSVQ